MVGYHDKLENVWRKQEGSLHNARLYINITILQDFIKWNWWMTIYAGNANRGRKFPALYMGMCICALVILFCLLGDRSQIPNVSWGIFSVIMVVLVSASSIILRHWKTAVSLDLKDRINTIVEMHLMSLCSTDWKGTWMMGNPLRDFLDLYKELEYVWYTTRLTSSVKFR